ncbi:radical SAM protein [bacterium]|nr:MAG: radical SAM protein [bacterium]
MDDRINYRAPLKSPLTVSLWITESCNLSCKYCYADATRNFWMESDRLYRLIEELKELEVFDITIAGGEPFLHPNVFDVIERILNSRMQLGVLTNGVLLDKKKAERLASIAEGKKMILQISLDSPDPVINDQTRSKGALVLQNLRNLAKHDLQLQISCVLSSVNVETAHLLIDELYPEVKRFHFLNIQRTERSLRYPGLLINDSQAHEFWMRLKKHSGKFPPDLFLPSLRIMLRSYGEEDSAESSEFHRRATFTCRSCSVGLTKIEIGANFDVLGCDIAKDFSIMGNIAERSFIDVWNSEQAFRVRNSPFPPCYRIRSEEGVALEDRLKSEFKCVQP